MNKEWVVVVNQELAIVGGDRLLCNSKSEALNNASFIARAMYNAGVNESHVFVVKRNEVDPLDELFCKVYYHYSVFCESGAQKMILMYEGWSNNQKKIASQWLDEEKSAFDRTMDKHMFVKTSCYNEKSELYQDITENNEQSVYRVQTYTGVKSFERTGCIEFKFVNEENYELTDKLDALCFIVRSMKSGRKCRLYKNERRDWSV